MRYHNSGGSSRQIIPLRYLWRNEKVASVGSDLFKKKHRLKYVSSLMRAQLVSDAPHFLEEDLELCLDLKYKCRNVIAYYADKHPPRSST